MFTHRNPTNPNPSCPPPRTATGSLGGNQSLNVFADRGPPHASTIRSVETDSSQPEGFPQDTLVYSTTPRPPPRDSGIGQQPTQRHIDGTPGSAPAFQSQPPDIPPTSVLLPPGSSARPFIPTQPGVRSRGEHPSRLPVPSPRRRSTRDNPRQYAADYTDWPIPSHYPGSDSPHYRPADLSGGVHAKVWPTYVKLSSEFDEKKLCKWNSDLDVLLVFAALFSAIVTAFLIPALDNLGPNYQQQSALLLYQLLNGRNQTLAAVSDPTALFKPSGFAITVSCLWFISLSASLGAGFGAIICKEWLTDYNGGTSPTTDLLRACQRQTRFMAFHRWEVATFISLLPPLLHISVLLFFGGAVLYLWQINLWVAVVGLIIGGILVIIYFFSTFLPVVMKAPFRPYSSILFYRITVFIGEFIIPVVDAVAYACFLAFRSMTGAILWLYTRSPGTGIPVDYYRQTRKIPPAEYKRARVWWANLISDSPDEIDTSQKVQEEAVLWLSQMPLDPSESEAVASSLSLISSSLPRGFPKSVITFLNLTIESSFNEDFILERDDVAKDCVVTLGHIKYQWVVDHNLDRDHDIGGVVMTPLVALAAQQLAVRAFSERLNHNYPEAIRARLLTAAAWLSPVDATEVVTSGGEGLKIQDRWEFVEKIKATLKSHVRSGNPLDGKVLVNLIHGMHACIPRGNYGSASSIVSFLPLICEDHGSPWSEDESTINALIAYCLDLVLPPTWRKPLVEREIRLDELVSELINALMINPTHVDVLAFGLWLIHRVPYALKSRASALTDITRLWALSKTNGTISDDRREQMNLYAINAFVAIAQYHTVANDALPVLVVQDTMDLLNAALGDGPSRPMAIYAVAMILNLCTPAQTDSLVGRLDGTLFAKTLYTVSSDLERNTAEEDVVNLHIYSAIVLLRLRFQADVKRVEALVEEMERTIWGLTVGDPGIGGNFGANPDADLDRVRWKAIYLSGLLSKLLPSDEGLIERLRERVRVLLKRGGLPLVGDWEHCLEPLAPGPLELAYLAGPWGPVNNAFEGWVGEFPLYTLAGSVTSVKKKMEM